MLHGEALGLLVGAVALGAVHGIEPGHGWPVAASYALDQSNKWLYGFAASFLLGLGHLVSSIAMVAVFFYAKAYFQLTQVNEPIVLLRNVNFDAEVAAFGVHVGEQVTHLAVGGPVSIVAGLLLVALGIREYRHGHSHGHGGDHGHDHSHDHGHSHDHDHSPAPGHDQGHSHAHDEFHGHDHGSGVRSLVDDSGAHEASASESHGYFQRLGALLPFVGGHSHSHGRGDLEAAADRGLLGIAWFAFVLGFAHEEEFEIIALCAGSDYCLELMSAYALTVIVGIVGLTLLLVAGYHRFEEHVERYTPYLPVFSATVLVVMGLGFVTGVF